MSDEFENESRRACDESYEIVRHKRMLTERQRHSETWQAAIEWHRDYLIKITRKHGFLTETKSETGGIDSEDMYYLS